MVFLGTPPERQVGWTWGSISSPKAFNTSWCAGTTGPAPVLTYLERAAASRLPYLDHAVESGHGLFHNQHRGSLLQGSPNLLCDPRQFLMTRPGGFLEDAIHNLPEPLPLWLGVRNLEQVIRHVMTREAELPEPVHEPWRAVLCGIDHRYHIRRCEIRGSIRKCNTTPLSYCNRSVYLNLGALATRRSSHFTQGQLQTPRPRARVGAVPPVTF